MLAHPTRHGYLIVLGLQVQVMLREAFGERVSPRAMGIAMRELQCESERVRIERQRLRVWYFKRQLDEPDWIDDDEDPQKELDVE